MVWTRILKLSDENWLGVLDDELFLGSYQAPIRRVDPVNPTGLLPCLEQPRSVVVAELQNREAELGLSTGSLGRLVPLDAIPSAAVASKMDYWVQLALDWLAETPPDEASEELLKALERASWVSQQARHRARHLQKRH